MVSRFEGAQNMGRGIEPLDEFVLIEPVDEETETSHGLIIPASAESTCSAGVVVAVGDEAHGISPATRCCTRAEWVRAPAGGEPKRLIRRRELIARVLD